MLQSGFDSISLPVVFPWKKSIGFSNYKKYDGSECIIIWLHGFWPKGSCLIWFWWLLLALWLVVYPVMLMINFSFLVVLFEFMQYETYKLSWFLQRGAFPLFPTQNGLIFMSIKQRHVGLTKVTFQVHKTICFTIWSELGNQGKNEHANTGYYI